MHSTDFIQEIEDLLQSILKRIHEALTKQNCIFVFRSCHLEIACPLITIHSFPFFQNTDRFYYLLQTTYYQLF